jgi:hypothetical protein
MKSVRWFKPTVLTAISSISHYPLPPGRFHFAQPLKKLQDDVYNFTQSHYKLQMLEHLYNKIIIMSANEEGNTLRVIWLGPLLHKSLVALRKILLAILAPRSVAKTQGNLGGSSRKRFRFAKRRQQSQESASSSWVRLSASQVSYRSDVHP